MPSGVVIVFGEERMNFFSNPTETSIGTLSYLGPMVRCRATPNHLSALVLFGSRKERPPDQKKCTKNFHQGKKLFIAI